jgi:hypothetical protein
VTTQQRRKVRWPRRVACGHYVLTGQVIIGRGQRWVCRDCALAELGFPGRSETK